MRIRRDLKIALVSVAILSVCFVYYYNFSPMVCNQANPIAELDAGNNRIITIYAEERCWEEGRSLYYSVKDTGKVVLRKSFFDVDQGNDHHSYSLVYAENQALVGVLETTTTPIELAIIYDFRSGETWPASNDLGDRDFEVLRWYSRIQKLTEENPQVNFHSLLD